MLPIAKIYKLKLIPVRFVSSIVVKLRTTLLNTSLRLSHPTFVNRVSYPARNRLAYVSAEDVTGYALG